MLVKGVEMFLSFTTCEAEKKISSSDDFFLYEIEWLP